MSTPAADLHPCACGCRTQVRGTYARGHFAKAEAARRKLTPLPGPGVPDDELDMGILEPDLPGDSDAQPDPYIDQMASEHQQEYEPDERLIEPDKPPGHLNAPSGTSRGGARKIRVTATTRRDISAKVGMLLLVPGKIWEARDPWCGGAFVTQLPATRDALADIICDSADLVAWFTGPAGGFMKYLSLATALQPVGIMVWAHHVAHSVGSPDGQASQPDMARYAA